MPETTILDERAVSEIEARAAKASKGPWESPANQQPWPDNAAHFEAIITADGGWIHRRNWKQVCLNMDFISHAREDIPALCATVKHLQAEKEELRNQKWTAERVVAWLDDPNPQPAIHAFTASNERQIAYRVERLRDDLQSQLEQLRAENERLTKDSTDLAAANRYLLKQNARQYQGEM